METYRLRDMPGVSEIEALCKVPSYFDDRNLWDTLERIDEVSIALFSLSYFGTGYDDFEWGPDEETPTREQWDALLSNALKPYRETRPFWEAAGWDITDGEGNELECAHYFAKQIILAKFANIEGVQVTPDGSGGELYEAPELSEDELAMRLEQEAKAFLLRRAS